MVTLEVNPVLHKKMFQDVAGVSPQLEIIVLQPLQLALLQSFIVKQCFVLTTEIHVYDIADLQ